jgi:hypothetical protein
MISGVKVKVSDRSGNLQDLPGDIIDLNVETVCNGGSGTGYLTFARPFSNIGAIDHDYRTQIWIPNPDGTWPTDPFYDGRVMKVDRQQLATAGRIKAYVEGWFTALNYGIVTATVTPGVQPNGIDNGQQDAGALINLFAGLYSPATPVAFGTSGPTTIGVNVGQLQWDGAGLAQVINDITQSILDSNNSLYDWFVVGKADKSITVTWGPEQNPNIVGTANWLTLFQTDIDQYQIVDDFSRIINMIVAYGGMDPFTQQTVWNPYSNSGSIATYTLRQAKKSWTTATNLTQLSQLATAFLQRFGLPQSAGQFRILKPTPVATAGQWVQVFETPTVKRQMKITRVELRVNKQRVEQICTVGIPLPAVEQLAQGPDPTGSYNAGRTSSVKPASLTQDSILGGVLPSWPAGGQNVSYSLGVARIGGTTLNVNGKQTTAVNHVGGYPGSGSPQTITVNTMNPIPTVGTGVLVDVGAQLETVYPTSFTATTMTGIFAKAHANGAQIIVLQATLNLPNGTTTTYLDGAGFIHPIAIDPFQGMPIPISAQPGQIALDDFTVLNGKITGWRPRAPRGGFDASSPLNLQASVNPFATNSNVTSSATTTIGGGPGSSTVTVSWSSFTVYNPDGSSIAVAGGSTVYASLNPSTTYWFLGVYVEFGCGYAVVVPAPQTSQPTVQQENTINLDGNIGMISAFSITTPAAGGSGTGGGGHGVQCPAPWQMLERKHRDTGEIGYVPAIEVEIGDLLPLGDEWKRVYAKTVAPCELIKVWVNGKMREVDAGHLWPVDGDWLSTQMLSLTTPIESVDGKPVFAQRIERSGPGLCVQLSVQGGLYTFDRVKAHNFPQMTF